MTDELAPSAAPPAPPTESADDFGPVDIDALLTEASRLAEHTAVEVGLPAAEADGETTTASVDTAAATNEPAAVALEPASAVVEPVVADEPAADAAVEPTVAADDPAAITVVEPAAAAADEAASAAILDSANAAMPPPDETAAVTNAGPPVECSAAPDTPATNSSPLVEPAIDEPKDVQHRPRILALPRLARRIARLPLAGVGLALSLLNRPFDHVSDSTRTLAGAVAIVTLVSASAVWLLPRLIGWPDR